MLMLVTAELSDLAEFTVASVHQAECVLIGQPQ